MSTVRTWADGFGRWYAEAENGTEAARAIEHELEIRGEKHLGVRIIVQTTLEYGPNVWREA